MNAPMCGVTLIPPVPAQPPQAPPEPPHVHSYETIGESLVCEGCGKVVTS